MKLQLNKSYVRKDGTIVTIVREFGKLNIPDGCEQFRFVDNYGTHYNDIGVCYFGLEYNRLVEES